MSKSNTKIWDSLCKTDPNHTKTFRRAGGFSGTAVSPIWVILRMTEQFGAMGTGWGSDQPKFDVVNAGDSILVYCTVSVWYGSRDQFVHGVGGDKVSHQNKNGHQFDDEAFKKAHTDALMNALKHIGVAADVHMGKFDDSKYVEQMRDEFSDPSKADGYVKEAIDFLKGPNELKDIKDARAWWVKETEHRNNAQLSRDHENKILAVIKSTFEDDAEAA